jgi:hypothetical protein
MFHFTEFAQEDDVEPSEIPQVDRPKHVFPWVHESDLRVSLDTHRLAQHKWR